MNFKCYLLSIAGFMVFQTAQARPPEMNLSNEQKACIAEQVGEMSLSNRPSRDEMRQAFETCGVERPERRGGHHGPRGFTDEQRTCLESKLGAPGSNRQRPSREEMDEAMSSCGVERPEPPRHQSRRDDEFEVEAIQ